MGARQTLLAAVLVGFALFVPHFFSEYHVSFLLQLFMMVALAQAWNLISGMTGYVSFGHAAFFGIGSYAGTLLLQAGSPWWLTVLEAGAIAGLVSVPLGLLTLRLRGPYFAIAMLGLNEVCRAIATLWVDLTRGGNGITISPVILPSLTSNYYTMLLLAVAATALMAWVYHHRLGLELRAIREDEGAAEMVGVNTTRNKLTAFVLSALVPGAVGTVYAFYTSYVNPSSVFSPALNIQMIVMVILGGSGTVWGPVLGATLVMTLREVLWANFPALHLAAVGGLLLLSVLFLPGGLLSLGQTRKRLRADLVKGGRGG